MYKRSDIMYNRSMPSLSTMLELLEPNSRCTSPTQLAHYGHAADNQGRSATVSPTLAHNSFCAYITPCCCAV